jgi:TolA-binding protein
MHRFNVHITPLIIFLLGATAIAQVSGSGGFLYDMGIVIGDSTQQDSIAVAEEAANGEKLIQELERYQEQLALTEMRMKVQTRVIDSLKAEIERMEASRQTDMALMNSKLSDMEKSQNRDVPGVMIAGSEPNVVLDSVYAELTEDEPTAFYRPGPAAVVLTPLSDEEARQRYKQGLTKFHQQYYYSAIEDFKQVQARANDQDLRASSQYWIGRSYFEKGLYDEAIMSLEKLRHFPDSDKQDDALVLIGLSFQQKNDLSEAKVAFRELVTQHPGSEYLTLARRFIRN